MATVYLAFDKKLEREVALKHLDGTNNDDKSSFLRFYREFQAAAKIRHPNIIQLYDIEELIDGHFFTMQLISGGTLTSLLKKSGSLPTKKALEVTKQVALALEALHEQNIVHRDLKPSNILFTQDGRAVLADFGLARDLAATAITETGAMVGTPSYMSPEQIRSEDVDGRSDIYQLGLMHYEMVAGKLPFKQTDLATLLNSVLFDDVPPLIEIKPHTPAKHSRIVSKCLAKEPADRFHSATDLIAALDDLLQPAAATIEPSQDELPVVKEKGGESSGRSGKRSQLASLLILTIIVLIALRSINSTKQLTPAKDGGLKASGNLAAAIKGIGGSGALVLAQDYSCEETIEVTGELSIVSPRKHALEFLCAPAFVVTSGNLEINGVKIETTKGPMFDLRQGELSLKDCHLLSNGQAITIRGKQSHLLMDNCEVEGKGSSVISVREDCRAELSRVRVHGPLAKQGINVFKCRSISVNHCTVSSCQIGLVAYGPCRIELANNELTESKIQGMQLIDCNDFSSNHDVVRGSSLVGVEVKGGSPTFEDLTASGKTECLKLVGGCEPVFKKSIFKNGTYGCVVENSAPTFENCLFTKNTLMGLRVIGRGRVTAKDCGFKGNSEHGAIISETSTGSFWGCRFMENKLNGCRTKGITYLEECQIKGNGRSGFVASHSSSGKLRKTTATLQNEYGIDIRDKTDNEIVDCEIRNNNRANLRSGDSARLKCSSCIFNDAKRDGVICDSKVANLFADCTFTRNEDHGMKAIAGKHKIVKALFRENRKGLYIKNAEIEASLCIFFNNKEQHLIARDAVAMALNCTFKGLAKDKSILSLGRNKIEIKGCTFIQGEEKKEENRMLEKK